MSGRAVRKVIVIAFMIAGSAASYFYLGPDGRAALVERLKGAAPKQAPKERPVAVTAAVAQKSDVPVTLNALGTVQAANTVQIRARVDGALEAVNFTEGQIVKKGDLLAQIDPRVYKAALDQAKAKLAQDDAQLTSDTKDLERSEQLGERAFASKQSIDQQRAAVAKGKALIASDKAAIEVAEAQLTYCTIIAPFTGRIGLRGVDPGNLLRASDATPIATLTQHQPVAVLFSLPEAELAALRKAANAGPVPVIAHDPDGAQAIATGELRVIDNQIDIATGTIRLKAEFANEDNALWPGQYAPVTVRLTIRRGVIALPSAAIQRGPKGLFVWIVNEEKHAKMAPVEIGPVQGDLTIVENGVNPGDRVVLSGQYRLRNDTPVIIEEAKVSERERKNNSAKQ